MTKKSLLRDVVAVGIMAALVFVASQISIPVPAVIGISRLHLGNIFCLLGGFLLGGVRGGLAAGLGSMLFDFTNPLYISSAPITFVNKFLMAFVCGIIASRNKDGKPVINFAAAIAGALTYVALYLGKNFVTDVFFLRTEVQTALIDIGIKAGTSLINATIAVILSVPLALALRGALKRTGLVRVIGGK